MENKNSFKRYSKFIEKIVAYAFLTNEILVSSIVFYEILVEQVSNAFSFNTFSLKTPFTAFIKCVRKKVNF
jgi:hypothetical protein